MIGCGQNTVKTTLQRFKEHQTVKKLYRTGRNPISNERDERNLINMVKKDRRLNTSQLALEWCLSNGKLASPIHVQKVLQQHNSMWRPACKKPRLTEKHKKTRLEVLLENKTFPLVFLLSYNKGPPIDDKDMTQL